MRTAELKLESDKLKTAIRKVARKYQLRLVNEEINVWGVFLLYQNQTTGVRCSFSPREGSGWIVIIGKLRNNSFPPAPIRITDDTVLDRFSIRDIGSIHSSRLPQEMLEKLRDVSFAMSADDVAMLLDRCCDDILRGDFSSFGAAETIVRERDKRWWAEHPRKK